MKLSEGGAPCVKENTDHKSTQADKQSYKIMPSAYYEQCPEIEIGEMTFKHSKLYTEVAGFDVTNEWDLLVQNERTGAFASKAPIDYVRQMSNSGWDKER